MTTARITAGFGRGGSASEAAPTQIQQGGETLKTTIEIPQAGRPEKVVRLSLDHEAQTVEVAYTGFKTPVVELAELARAIEELRSRT